jgi:hypothetical protein
MKFDEFDKAEIAEVLEKLAEELNATADEIIAALETTQVTTEIMRHIKYVRDNT